MNQFNPVDIDSLTVDGLVSLIDQTMLKPDATIEEYSIFLSGARKWGFKSVFVPPCYVPLACGILSGTDVVVGAPVSFPFGYAAPETKASEALVILEDGGREIDVVMNISAALSGEWEIVSEDLEVVVGAVKKWEEINRSPHITLKLILETPYLHDEQKREACRRAVEAGMDYVKTATGFSNGGATVEDVRLMREVVGEHIGVKASGGIRTWLQARAMLEAGATRIGTSTGQEIVIDFERAKEEGES
ncbi:MAG: deoxyribose-phosphate aldolase [Actinomycetota bacterium]|nr:deoxyribose-phosphate aldolase [Actinomycetota bacterium]